VELELFAPSLIQSCAKCREEIRAIETDFVPNDLGELAITDTMEEVSSCYPHREQMVEFAIFL